SSDLRGYLTTRSGYSLAVDQDQLWSFCRTAPEFVLLHEVRRDRGAQLPTGLQGLLVGLAEHGERLGGLLPAQPGGDRLDGPVGALHALVAVPVVTERWSCGGAQARVVDRGEEVLQRPADVRPVRGRARQVAVGFQIVARRGAQRGSADHLYPGDLFGGS